MQKLSEVADLAVVIKDGLLSFYSLRGETISIAVLDRDTEGCLGPDSHQFQMLSDDNKWKSAFLEFTNPQGEQDILIRPTEVDAEWPE